MLYKMTDEDLSNILTHGRKKLLSLVPSRRYGESLNVGHYISSGLVKFRDGYVSADNNKWYDVVRGLSSRLGDSGKRARKMNFEFNLTLEYLCDLWITQKGRCAVSNIPLSFMSGTVWDKNPYSCSIDRINNDQGHVLDNVVPACARCNYLRRDMPHEAWLILVPAVRLARESGAFGDWDGFGRKKKIGELTAPGIVPVC